MSPERSNTTPSKRIPCKVSHRIVASKGPCLNQLISSKSQDLRIGLVRNSRRREGQISGNCGKTENLSTINGLQRCSSVGGNYDRLSPERLPNRIIFTTDDDSFTSVGWEMSHFHYISQKRVKDFANDSVLSREQQLQRQQRCSFSFVSRPPITYEVTTSCVQGRQVNSSTAWQACMQATLIVFSHLVRQMPFLLCRFNPLVTNGFSQTYQMDKSTSIFRGSGVILHVFISFFDEIHVIKQNSPRCDAAFCDVRSGAILFAYVTLKDTRQIWSKKSWLAYMKGYRQKLTDAINAIDARFNF